MNKKNAYSMSLIKKIGFLIISAIVLVLGFFLLIQLQSGRKEYKDKLLINIFGKQRMYTQMISKDAHRLYLLLQNQEAKQIYITEEEIREKISETKDSLSMGREEFVQILTSMEKGYVEIESYQIDIREASRQASEYLVQLDDIWSDVADAIDTLASSDAITEDTIQAIAFISDKNLELLSLSDQILQIIIDEAVRTTRRFNALGYTMIALLSIFIVAALIHLMKYILLPFQQMYMGLSRIGLEHYPENFKLPTRNKMDPVVGEIGTMFLKIKKLISLIENMNNSSSFTETLDFINQTFSPFIPYNYIGIALFSDDKRMLTASYGVSDGTIEGMREKFVGKSWYVRDTSLEHVLNTGEPRIINDMDEYTYGKPIKKYNQIIMEAGIRSSITLPLKVAGDPVGLIFFSSNQKNVYTEDHQNFLKTLVNSIAVSFNQNIFIDDIIISSILALAKLAEARDEDTGDHLDRMKIYSREIAELLYENNTYPDEISLDYINHIERFSPLHDIGKVGVRDGILLKPGKLSPEEYEEMKHHALYGAKVLMAAEENFIKRDKSLFSMGIEIAEGHHEKWDGSGYPYGKKGLEIPLSARIVAIADVFDALTSKRPYKKAFSFDLALSLIAEGKGKHFDPMITEVFLENRHRIEKIYKEFQLQIDERTA